jgi:hypothetical protein
MRAITVTIAASLIFFMVVASDVAAQAGYISTIVGNGTLVNCDADPPPFCITASGDGGPALAAGFGYTQGVALDSAENLYIVDYYGHRVRRVGAATGIITTFAGNGTSGTGGDGGPATSAQLWYPVDVVFDAADNLYISMLTGDRVRKVDAATGLISCVAGCAYSFADGIPATSSALSDPGALAVDSLGNLYVANGHVNFSSVRKIDKTTGLIWTVAGTGVPGFNGDGILATSAQLRIPAGIAVDAVGNVYIADQYNHRIRKVDAVTGIITTIAGTGDGTVPLADEGLPASQARIHYPGWLEFDAGGNLFFSTGQTVRRIDAQTGILTTVAGDGTYGFYGDGGPATAASLKYPHGIVFDSAGNLLISDSTNLRIRRVESVGPPGNEPPHADAGGPYEVPEGTTVLLDASGSTDSDLPDEILNYNWDLDGDGLFDDAVGAAVSYLADDGTSVRTVTIQVCDDDNACDTAEATVTIHNVAPEVTLDTAGTVTLPSGQQAFLGRKGTPQLHTATANDPGSDDLTFAWSFGQTTTYLNDDPNVDQEPEVVAGTAPFAASDTGTVTFAAAGVYTIGVSVADDDGGVGGASLTKLVTDDCDCTKSQGYWKHQFDPKRKGGNLIPQETLQTYLDVIGEASGAFAGLTPEQAYVILKQAKVKAQTLAAWSNFAKGAIGWDELVDTNGDRIGDRTFGSVITEIELILSNPAATGADLERGKDLAESINLHDKNNGLCESGVG